MIGHPWDESGDNAGDFPESSGHAADVDSDENAPGDRHRQKHRLTELRRRAEERLEWKRMHGAGYFGDLDSLDEGLDEGLDEKGFDSFTAFAGHDDPLWTDESPEEH